MREVTCRKIQLQRRRRIRNYLAFTLLLVSLCLTGIVYNVLVVKATPKNNPADGLYKYYTEIIVRRDDTLRSIAQTHYTEGYTSVDELMNEISEINSLVFYQIDYGQHLIIPYYSAEYK